MSNTQTEENSDLGSTKEISQSDKLLQTTDLESNQKLEEDARLKQDINIWVQKTYDMSEFIQIIEAINSQDRFQQHYGVIGLRKILSNENAPPIQPVIDANLVPRLVEFMKNNKEPHLQLEAAWSLTNVASGTTEQAQVVVSFGSIPCFIELLHSPRLDIAEQAIWGIGNLAGDSARFRDLILNNGGLKPLLNILDNIAIQPMMQHAVWALKNLCSGKPLPDVTKVEAAIPTLSRIIQQEKDITTLTDALYGMSSLIKHPKIINDIVQTGIIPSLVGHIKNTNTAVDFICLQILGTIISSSNEEQTDMVLGIPEFLPKIFRSLQNRRKVIRREVCWGISNITAGNSKQIGRIMSDPYYVDMLLKVASSDVPEVQREAAWAFSNATKDCTVEQIRQMLNFGVLDCLIRLLDVNDAKTLEVALNGIDGFLHWGTVIARQNSTQENYCLRILEDRQAVEKIESLQTHPNDEVYLKALKILENYFELEEA